MHHQFRTRLKDKEINPPMRYSNKVVEEYIMQPMIVKRKRKMRHMSEPKVTNNDFKLPRATVTSNNQSNYSGSVRPREEEEF